jgi:hypothetical protein
MAKKAVEEELEDWVDLMLSLGHDREDIVSALELKLMALKEEGAGG